MAHYLPNVASSIQHYFESFMVGDVSIVHSFLWLSSVLSNGCTTTEWVNLFVCLPMDIWVSSFGLWYHLKIDCGKLWIYIVYSKTTQRQNKKLVNKPTKEIKSKINT